MQFDDEPRPEDPFPPKEGHVSGGRLERVLRAGGFAVTAELSPPDSADGNEVYRRAAVFDGLVDAMNVTDGSGANCHMSSMGMSALLGRKGYSPVLQISCRDRNRIAIQGDVLGAAAMGISNVMVITGDDVSVGDHPQAKPVFDLDSMGALDIIRRMRDEGRFHSGREITVPPRMLIGEAENPFVPPYEYRPYRLAKKIACGAGFIQTQYCYDINRLRSFMKVVRELGLHEKVFILVGVGPLRSAKAAEWMRSNVPGVVIPDAIVERMDGAADPRAEGIAICVDMIREIRQIEGIAGIHVMAYRMENRVAEIIERSGVLAGRVPWYPGRDGTVEKGGQPAAGSA